MVSLQLGEGILPKELMLHLCTERVAISNFFLKDARPTSQHCLLRVFVPDEIVL